MSQERTEHRDWAKDREIIEASSKGPWVRDIKDSEVYGKNNRIVADCNLTANGARDRQNALFIAESREAWPAALDEIDRLNAVNAELTAKVQERDETTRKLRRENDWLRYDLKKQSGAGYH